MRGRSGGAPRRPRPVWSIGRGRLLVFTASALAVVVAAGAPKGPAHAADPAANPTADPGTAAATTSPATDSPLADPVSWNPGDVSYLVDNGGCHTTQAASIDTTTSALADTVAANLEADSVKVAHFSSHDPDVKVVQINGVHKNGTHIALTIDGWLSNTACAQATSAPAQQTSFTTGHGAGAAATTPRVLGTVNLTDRHQIALMSAFTWFVQALKVVAAAVAYVAIVTITLGIVAAIVAEGGAALAVAAQAALAGCIGYAMASLAVGLLLTPELTSTGKGRIAVAVAGCLTGAVGGATVARRVGPALAQVVRRRLNTTPAIMGDSGLAAAKQAGVDVSGVADLVDGVADGALQASQ